MLAMHKDSQQKMIDEIDEIVGPGDDITNEDLSKFTFTEMVIKESLRLLGPGGTLGRTTSQEMELGGYTIPKGACFVLNMYKMHRSPKYWGEDAHLFRPERFEPENIKNIHPHAFAPFSGMKFDQKPNDNLIYTNLYHLIKQAARESALATNTR
jgi:cytochrome P450